jgi:hypothetical protein
MSRSWFVGFVTGLSVRWPLEPKRKKTNRHMRHTCDRLP